LLWVKGITKTQLKRDKILIVDDGSPTVPYVNYATVTRDNDLPEQEPTDPIVIQRYSDNLGRRAMFDYPGWYRSFVFAAKYAKTYGYDKVIHVESDAFLISDRICEYLNEFSEGWETPLFQHCRMPETSIQVMAGSGLEEFYKFIDKPYDLFRGMPADPPLDIIKESYLPFTVNESFNGSRFDDMNITEVPRDFDYVSQMSKVDKMWWLD
jgi:hypothetical protein